VNGNKHTDRFIESVKNENAQIMFVSAEIESDMIDMEEEDKMMFLEDMGLQESGVNRIIKSAYKLLNYQTYFTAGEKEVRAWTITEGYTAPQAAGVIHTDFEKGFIRAEVIGYNDYIEYESEAKCREAGKLRVEGKDYLVKDGDIMHFRFNV
jgi:ribosome-binding ATPase YchF (GTP1/OBG family)